MTGLNFYLTGSRPNVGETVRPTPITEQYATRSGNIIPLSAKHVLPLHQIGGPSGPSLYSRHWATQLAIDVLAVAAASLFVIVTAAGMVVSIFLLLSPV